MTRYVDKQKKLALQWEGADLKAKAAEAAAAEAVQNAYLLRAAADKLDKERGDIIAPIADRSHTPLFPVPPAKKVTKAHHLKVAKAIRDL